MDQLQAIRVDSVGVVAAWRREERAGFGWLSADDYVRVGLAALGVSVSDLQAVALADEYETYDGGEWVIARRFVAAVRGLC